MVSLDQYSWVVLYAPGSYIRDGIKYAESWRNNGWRNKQNQKIAYPDIWIRYLKLVDERGITIVLRHWGRDYKSIRNELQHQVRAARRT
jgi:ribonuclease HI